MKVVFFNFSIFSVGIFVAKAKRIVRILVGKTDVFRMTNSGYKRKKLHQNLTFMSIRKNSSYAINVHQMNGLSRISIQIEKQALELSRPWRLMPNIPSIYRKRAIITRSWILTIHKGRIFWKNLLEKRVWSSKRFSALFYLKIPWQQVGLIDDKDTFLACLLWVVVYDGNPVSIFKTAHYPQYIYIRAVRP